MDRENTVLTPQTLHTIRNNLNTILGYSQILLDEEIFSDEQMRMQSSIENAALNIRSLLANTQAETSAPNLPNTQNSAQHEKTKRQEESAPDVNAVMPKILIVDDNAEMLALFQDILRPYHYNIQVASNGAEALERATSFYPELILLDVVMPVMDGYQVLEALKKEKYTSEIPVIFLTANNTMDDVVNGFEAGAVDYIAKPFHPRELIARVDTHLKKAKILANLKRLMEHSFHELYTPLSVISSAMQMQELEHGKSDYTQMTLAASKTLQNIYDDLYYSINYSDAAKQKTTFDFVTLLRQRIAYFSLVAESRSLTFKTKLPQQLLMEMHEDELERVVDNLISNALKYSCEKSDITITIEKKSAKWAFSICNPILKNVDTKKIFQKYYRHENEIFGLGLGLDLVLSICKKNALDISASSDEKQFCINMELSEKP